MATEALDPRRPALRTRMYEMLQRWPSWVAAAALAWSVLYAAIAVFWALGGGGFPFGTGDPEAADMGSLLVDVRPGTLAPPIAVVCGLGAVVAWSMTRPGAGFLPRKLVVGVGWTLCAILLLAIPDVRLLRDFAYLFAGFVGFAEKFDLAAANQVVCVIGGVLWAAATLAFQRRTNGSCTYCGVNPEHRSDSTEESVWLRRGRFFTFAAIVVPLPYELSRWLWAAGWPVGVTTGGDEIRDWPLETRLGLVVIACLPLVGALLTHGLTKPWGEVFPRWVPRVHGKPVPVALVVLSAALAALMIMTAATSMQRSSLNVALGRVPEVTPDVEGWGAWAPGLVFLPWGLALCGATYAYWRRRRGRCQGCRVLRRSTPAPSKAHRGPDQALGQAVA